MGAKGIGEFFAGGDDAGFGFETGEKLVHDFGERGRSRVNDDVGGLLEDFAGVGGDFYAPGSVGSADNFAEVAADFFGVGVDGAANFDGVLFAHEPGDGSADGDDAELNGANFLFHWILLKSEARRYTAHFWRKGILYDKGNGRNSPAGAKMRWELCWAVAQTRNAGRQDAGTTRRLRLA